MANGLDLNLEQFSGMRAKDRDLIIFKNLVHIRKNLGDSKFHKKVQYVWLTVLTGFLGIKRVLGF